MAKSPAASTLLKAANLRIDDLEKKLKHATDEKDRWYKESREATDLNEQVHQVLDAVPHSIARKSEGENSWDRVERSALTRLAAWLAIRTF